jgi:hypothetical protein
LEKVVTGLVVVTAGTAGKVITTDSGWFFVLFVFAVWRQRRETLEALLIYMT